MSGLGVWDRVPRGDDPPRTVNVVIETPAGSRVKYAAGEGHGALEVTKLLPPGLAFPAHTGFFPQCAGEDGDPLDAMVLTGLALAPGCVCPARPIAVFRMVDRGDRDDKVVCVLAGDAEWEGAKGLAGVPDHVRTAFRLFHEAYRVQEGTQRSVRLGGWAGKADALRLLRAGYRRFDEGRGDEDGS